MTNSTLTGRDPVCGKNLPVAGSPYATTYRSIAFHFCSAQCLRRFWLRPEFYATSRQRTPGAQPIPKRHRLQVRPTLAGVVERACRQIREMSGVVSVEVGSEGLLLTYDLLRTTLGEIETIAEGEGLAFKDGLHGVRRRWWKFTEGNELDNAVHPSEAACCSRPPRLPPA